ncbi:unnamed protein product [Allacma fusca]|uniref:Uncharacterized protein n=1 Tax=Allacma fusca TaxID=39272 RepID=A0A8J2LLF5_9HEXA|nr:unnamed protein product [Allacma fusca]
MEEDEEHEVESLPPPEQYLPPPPKVKTHHPQNFGFSFDSSDDERSSPQRAEEGNVLGLDASKLSILEHELYQG